MAVGRLEIAPERFGDWLAHWLDEHPGATVTSAGPPGAVATTVGWPGGTIRCEPFLHEPLGVVLVRRGGYAVGLAQQGRVIRSAVGRRRVQGRTAAGGWSQQRYARRRANQAGELVAAVAGHAARLLGGLQLGGVLVGGDRTLVVAVLAGPEVAFLRDLPRRDLPDLPDPDGRVLARAVWRGRAHWCTGDLGAVSAP